MSSSSALLCLERTRLSIDAITDAQSYVIGIGMVEVWLQRLVDGMQGTVKNIIKRASRNVQEMRLEDFMFSHPAQIALLGIQFQWTADTQVHWRM